MQSKEALSSLTYIQPLEEALNTLGINAKSLMFRVRSVWRADPT